MSHPSELIVLQGWWAYKWNYREGQQQNLFSYSHSLIYYILPEPLLCTREKWQACVGVPLHRTDRSDSRRTQPPGYPFLAIRKNIWFELSTDCQKHTLKSFPWMHCCTKAKWMNLKKPKVCKELAFSQTVLMNCKQPWTHQGQMAPQGSWGIIIPILHRFHERRVTIPEIYYEAKITIILKSGKARLEYICVYLYLLCIYVYIECILYIIDTV